MKRMQKATAMLCAVFCYLQLSVGALGATAESETPLENELQQDIVSSDIVSTEAELKGWIAAHTETGGTVTFGKTITLTDYIIVACTPDAPIVIDTGAYGLVVDGGLLGYMRTECIGWMRIQGEGVDVPVLEILSVGGFMASWNRTIQDMDVTARGREGHGGIAVRILQDVEYQLDLSKLYTEGCIRSYGEGAIGIYFSEYTNAQCLNIQVEGEGAMAVYAPAGASLRYCKLQADGPHAVAFAGADESLLDTCLTNADIGNAEVQRYRIVDALLNELYYPLEQYWNGGSTVRDSRSIYFLLENVETKELYWEILPVCWDTDTNDIDTSQLGTQFIQGSFPKALQGFGLEDDFDLRLEVEVRPTDTPCIWLTEKYQRYNELKIYLWDMDDLPLLTQDYLRVYRSSDGGQVWQDITQQDEVTWHLDFGFINIACDTIYENVQFYVMTPDGKSSNVVTLHPTDVANILHGDSGDRTGTDRSANKITVAERPQQQTPNKRPIAPPSTAVTQTPPKDEDIIAPAEPPLTSPLEDMLSKLIEKLPPAQTNEAETLESQESVQEPSEKHAEAVTPVQPKSFIVQAPYRALPTYGATENRMLPKPSLAMHKPDDSAALEPEEAQLPEESEAQADEAAPIVQQEAPVEYTREQPKRSAVPIALALGLLICLTGVYLWKKHQA